MARACRTRPEAGAPDRRADRIGAPGGALGRGRSSDGRAVRAAAAGPLVVLLLAPRRRARGPRRSRPAPASLPRRRAVLAAGGRPLVARRVRGLAPPRRRGHDPRGRHRPGAAGRQPSAAPSRRRPGPGARRARAPCGAWLRAPRLADGRARRRRRRRALPHRLGRDRGAGRPRRDAGRDAALPILVPPLRGDGHRLEPVEPGAVVGHPSRLSPPPDLAPAGRIRRLSVEDAPGPARPGPCRGSLAGVGRRRRPPVPVPAATAHRFPDPRSWSRPRPARDGQGRGAQLRPACAPRGAPAGQGTPGRQRPHPLAAPAARDRSAPRRRGAGRGDRGRRPFGDAGARGGAGDGELDRGPLGAAAGPAGEGAGAGDLRPRGAGRPAAAGGVLERTPPARTGPGGHLREGAGLDLARARELRWGRGGRGRRRHASLPITRPGLASRPSVADPLPGAPPAAAPRPRPGWVGGARGRGAAADRGGRGRGGCARFGPCAPARPGGRTGGRQARLTGRARPSG